MSPENLYGGIVCGLWCCLKSEPNAQSLILNILDIKFYWWVNVEENKIHEMIFVFNNDVLCCCYKK